jgi:hypothetical protein
MLSNILWVFAAIIATLAILELYLGDNQKKRLASAVTGWWSWIADLSDLSFVEFLRDSAIQRWISWVSASLTFILFVASAHLGLGMSLDWFFAVVVFFAAIVVSLFAVIGQRILYFVFSQGWTYQIPFRAIIVLLAYFGLVVILVYPFLAGWGPPLVEFGGVPSISWSALLAIAFVLFGSLMLICTLLAPLTFLLIFRVLLSTIELTLRRIAEYPKGPILAISAVVAAAGGILKLFQG